MVNSMEQEGQIAVDPLFEGPDDSNSRHDDDRTLSTSSISSTILEYRRLHGRTYQNFQNAEYWGPNDKDQLEGLDINHHMLYLALDGKLFTAPVKDPKRILDVGTGTGNWAIDIADEFPNAEVIGIDLAPTQPTWVPPNCKFELDDASKPWTYPDNHFDFIHIRYMLGCFEDWVKLYKECYRCLKPGGWIEHMDCSISATADDGSLPANNMFEEWSRVFDEGSKKMGKTFLVIENDAFKGWLEEAGFNDVQLKRIKCPIGEWAAEKKWKEVGQLCQLSLEMGLEGFGLYVLSTVLGWEYAEIQAWLARMRQALRDRKTHTYVVWSTIWAQKPLA